MGLLDRLTGKKDSPREADDQAKPANDQERAAQAVNDLAKAFIGQYRDARTAEGLDTAHTTGISAKEEDNYRSGNKPGIVVTSGWGYTPIGEPAREHAVMREFLENRGFVLDPRTRFDQPDMDHRSNDVCSTIYPEENGGWKGIAERAEGALAQMQGKQAGQELPHDLTELIRTAVSDALDNPEVVAERGGKALWLYKDEGRKGMELLVVGESSDPDVARIRETLDALGVEGVERTHEFHAPYPEEHFHIPGKQDVEAIRDKLEGMRLPDSDDAAAKAKASAGPQQRTGTTELGG